MKLTPAAVKAWMRDCGARPMWDDTRPVPLGTEVYYEDRFGNRLYCRAESSQRVGDDTVNALATALQVVRWEPAVKRAPNA